MPLTNQQYDRLMHEYDERRMNSKRRLDLRTEKVCSAIPEIKEIDIKIAQEAVRCGRAAIAGDTGAADGLESRIESLTAKKKDLLRQAGYPENYLDRTYECEICHDTGLVDNKPCVCFKKAQTRLLFEESNLNRIIEKENFDTLRLDVYSDRAEDADAAGLTPYRNAQNVVQNIRDFAEHFDEKPGNLLIYGDTGLGKTFLTNSIAKTVLESGHYVLYYTACALTNMLEKYNFRYDEYISGGDCHYDSLFTCELLIIDDLGTEITNAFVISQLYDIINERLLSERSTIISTNLTLQMLNERYSERIFSRIRRDYDFYKLFGRDIRTILPNTATTNIAGNQPVK